MMGKFYNPVTAPRTSFLIFFLLLGVFTYGQNLNINQNELKNLSEVSKDKIEEDPFFNNALRARQFNLNIGFRNTKTLGKGQKIDLELFSDKNFPSTVIRVENDINGITTYTIKLDKYKFSYAYLSISANTYSMQIDLPELGERYSLKPNRAKTGYYIFQLDNSKFDKIEKCGVSKEKDKKQDKFGYKLEEGAFSSQPLTGECIANNGSVVIDVMIVYTQAASDWASTNEGDIQNTIANALAICNNISQNSELGITFNLVYSGLVDYVEDGSDYYYLRTDGEGKMDEVHQIRKQVGADLVTLFSDLDYALGVADLLTDRYGDPHSAFSVVRMSSASYGTTFMHELGHCLGASHNPYQKRQPGPTNWKNWEENSWSAGWRWTSSDGLSYTSVMSYPYGVDYDDGISSMGVPYFSDPDLIYLGAVAGSAAEGNNVKTIRETKYSVADYSETIAFCNAYVKERFNAYMTNVKIGDSENVSGIGNYSDFGHIVTCMAPQEEIEISVNTTDYKSNTVLKCWIDWNNDKVFDDSEEVFASEKYAEAYNFSIVAPLGVSPGDKKMRLRLIDLESARVLGACGISISGEIEDYTLSLYEPAQCAGASIPQNISIDRIQSKSITLSWDVIDGIDFYELQYKKKSEPEWTKINNIFYSNYKIRGLSSLTEYQFQLRSVCGSQASHYSTIVSSVTEPALNQIEFLTKTINGSAIQNLEPIGLQILDINGDVSNSDSQVTLSLNDLNGTGAILSGPNTLTAKEGKVFFESLSIDLPGTYSFKTRVEGIPEVTSSQFVLSDYSPVNYVVNTISDTDDADISDGICADSIGNCSLRAAIQNSNKSRGKDKVSFNITGTNPHRIILSKSLPAIVEPIILDATTQPGYSFDKSQIIIDGNGIAGISEEEGFYAFGLMGNSSGSEIRGFTIGGFDAGLYALAFHLRNTGNHTIQANKIGVTSDGIEKFPNFDGIYLNSSSNNTIGGFLPEERNIISGNVRGITLDDSNDNNIVGNYIGVNLVGSDTIQNTDGISAALDPRKRIGNYLAYPNNNRIESNLISGNNRFAIYVIGENNFITSNLIGTDATGEKVLGNSYGIYLNSGKFNQIGAQDKPNVISGNNYGVHVRYSTENLISNNLIGTDINGEKALTNSYGIFVQNNNASFTEGQIIESNLISGNSEAGIYLESNNNLVINNMVGTDLSGNSAIPNKNGIHILFGEKNRIGGVWPSESNIISGNANYGIWLEETYNSKITGNKIGTGKNINTPLANGIDGVKVIGRENIIGGTDSSSANYIANHPNAAISILYSYSTSNRISGNNIFNNGVGIDLKDDDITRNDSRDADSGPNYLQNYPELNRASYGSNLQIEYKLDSDPVYSTYPILIQLYKSDGNRQGKEYLGEFSISENEIPKGKKPLVAEVYLTQGARLISGDLIVATATDAEGNTSEFSDEVNVTITGTCTLQTWFADEDADGLGDPNSTLDQCTEPEGYVSNSNDCDDTDPEIGAPQTWYWDDDGDGFGDANISTDECTPQPGYVLDNTDCNDKDASIYPGALDDTADGKDQNCDGFDGPVTSCSGADNLLVSEVCSTNTSIEWQIENPGTCTVTGRWELRKMSSTGDSSGSFELAPGEIYNFTSGTVSKGKTQLVVYWYDSNGLELNTSLNATRIECMQAQASMSEPLNDLYISPNPISDEAIGMYFTQPLDEGKLQVKIYSSSGNLIATENLLVTAGTTSVSLGMDHSFWLEGVYIMNASINGQNYEVQFIK